MPPDPAAPPVVLCRPYLVDYDSINDRLRAFGDAPAAVADLAAEPLPTYDRGAQQQFLECLDGMSWGGERSDAHAAARALFDRLFWSWRAEELRIAELEFDPYGIDLAWGPMTLSLFAELWLALAPVLPGMRTPFEAAARSGEIVGRFDDFLRYATAWGEILARGVDDGLGLIVVRFDQA